MDRFTENTNSRRRERTETAFLENTYSSGFENLISGQEHDRSRRALAALKQKMKLGQRPEIRVVREYHRKCTRANLIALLGVVNGVPGSEEIAERLRGCTSKKRCRFYGCPTCGERIQRKERLEALKAIVARHGGMPEPSAVCFVSIRGAQTNLQPEQVLQAVRRLKTRLKAVQKGPSLRSSSWFGWFDVSSLGVVHFHGLVLHPGISVRVLWSRLSRQIRGHKVVKVSAWHKDHTLLDNLVSVLTYSLPAGRHTRMVKDIPSLGVRSAEAIAKRLVCLRAMARVGIRGIRMRLNLDTPRVWIAGVLYDPLENRTIVVREVEELILGDRREKRRRARSAWFREKVGQRGESEIVS